MKYCIHERSEKQKLCRLRSKCCDDLVKKVNLHTGHYKCKRCNNKCDYYEITLNS